MNALEVLRLVLLATHLIGMSAIIGAFIFQLPQRTGRLNFQPMLVGSIVQLASGIALIATRKLEELPVIDEKMFVKLGIAVLVLVAVLIGRKAARQRPWFMAVGILAIADVVVAIAWR